MEKPRRVTMYDVRWKEIISHSTLIEADSKEDAIVGVTLLTLTSTGSLGEDDKIIDEEFLGVSEIIGGDLDEEV